MALETIVSSVSENILDRLFNAAGRQLGYLLHYNNNIKTLKKQVKKLEDMRERLQGKIDAAERNGEIIEADVQTWAADVDKITAEAQKLLAEEVKANKWCLKGWCINPRSRYGFSKKAQHKSEEVIQLQTQGNFESVSRPAPPPGIVSPILGFSGAFESRKLIMKEIMEALKDDNVSIIGICGMGGAGKTTLVKDIRKQAEEEELFDAIVMAAVSQSPSIMEIQKGIANMLGLTLQPNDNDLARAGHLWERIKKQRILVILDDIWGRIDLEKIGIPFGVNHRGCKVMFTSRSKDVCEAMDAERIFAVGMLSEQESWALFREAAGLNPGNSDIKPIAKQIAAKCGGLPIAILTIARALKNKSKAVWADAARQLKKSTPTGIKGMHENVIQTLELSYNYLQSEEEKSLFLFCCLFPDDYWIPQEELVRYGMGLKWFKDLDTMEEARDRVDTIVSTLASSFLLIADDEHKCVKMHDVVRDVAQIIAPKYKHIFMVKAGIGLQKWPSADTCKDFTGISLMSNSINELPDGLECPRLQVLLLQKNSALVVPHNFFQEMKDLNVLDLSNTKLSPLPPSLQFLTNLRTLCLNYCKLRGLSVVGNLTNLEILSLSHSDIVEIPIDFGQLTRLRLFDLTSCIRLTLISYGVISHLHKLEELYMRGSFDNWGFEREGDSRHNAKIIELQELSLLTCLHICIPKASNLLNNMPFQNLKSFTIGIGVTSYELRTQHSLGKYSTNMMLSHDMKILLQFDWVKSLLKRTENLIFCEVIDSENILSDLVNLANEGFNSLKALTVTNCKEVRYLFDTLKWRAQVIFKDLEILEIDGNPIVEIWHDQLSGKSFSKVKILQVRRCPNIFNIVPSYLLQRFQNLEIFEAGLCESLVNVFDLGMFEIVKAETKLLSSLKQLTLWNLPELTNIWCGDTQFLNLCNLKSIELNCCRNLKKLFPASLLQSLTSLEDLTIDECDKLEEVFEKGEAQDQGEEIVCWLNKDHTTSFPSLQNLSRVYVNQCNTLKTLFSPSICKSLVLLKRLEVVWCKSMEEIITNEEGEKGASIERIVFPNLQYIRLKFLDNLTCFCSGSFTIEFPALEDLKIAECPKMKTFGFGDQITPKLKIVKLFYTTDEGRWIGNLNNTVEQFFNEQAMTREQYAQGLPVDIPIED